MNDLNEEGLAKLVTRGGIYYNVPGSTRDDILSNIIAGLTALPPGKSKWSDSLLQAVIEREALISTGIENGIALPHPRTPMLKETDDPFVAIAFTKNPIDWETPDGSQVHTVFLIVSKSPKQHLGALGKINFLCQQKDFYNLLCAQASKEQIVAALEEAEKGWG